MSASNYGQLYDQSFWHRLNQIYAETGQTCVMPDAWEATQAMDDAICVELPYDRDPVARRIAGHVVGEYSKAWDAIGRRQVYEGWCPESEANLLVFSYDYGSGYAVALRSLEQLRDIKRDMMAGGGHFRCNTRVNRNCKGKTSGPYDTYPVEFLAIKRGENICAFIACHHCLLHISSGAGVHHPDYVGPAEDWYDDRQAF